MLYVNISSHMQHAQVCLCSHNHITLVGTAMQQLWTVMDLGPDFLNF